MSEFDRWIEEQDKLLDWDDITPTEQMRLAWNASRKQSEADLATAQRELYICAQRDRKVSQENVELQAELAAAQAAFQQLREKFDDALLKFSTDLVTVAKERDAAIRELVETRADLATARAALERACIFFARIASQRPEKPDSWSSCGQCDHNIDDAKEELELARAALDAAREETP